MARVTGGGIMERLVRANPSGIAEFPGTMVAAGEELFLGIVHAFLTVVLLTATGIILFNPVLFQNTALVAVVGGIALIDLLVSRHMNQGR